MAVSAGAIRGADEPDFLTFRCDGCTIWCREAWSVRGRRPRGQGVFRLAFVPRRPEGKTEFLEPVLQGAPRETEKAGRSRDAASLPQRLLQKLLLENFEGDSRVGDLDPERPFVAPVTDLLGQVLQTNGRALAEEHRPLDRRLE